VEREGKRERDSVILSLTPKKQTFVVFIALSSPHVLIKMPLISAAQY